MKKYIYLLLVILIVSCSQEEFNLDYTNDPSAQQVFENPIDFKNFNVSNHTAVASAQVDLDGVFFRAMSDQFTATNAFLGFWSFTDEPRRQITNATTNDDLPQQVGGPWSAYYEVLYNANTFLNGVENDNIQIIINDTDFTIQERACAYFDRAMALGYLSYVYDKAYIVDHNTDLTNVSYSSYSEVLSASISDFNTAFDLAEQYNGTFEYKTSQNGDALSLNDFKKLGYSYMARFSIGVARTDLEAQSLDYNQILSYANSAITSDYFPLSIQDTFYNNLQDWSLFVLGDGAGYMPTDLKIQHLFDPNYPTSYPLDETIILGEANSTDPRLSEYYEYVGDAFGFLRADRGRHLFSSYRHIRYFDNNNENQSGLPVQLFPKAEIDYIKAECYYRLGDIASAVSILDASPRMTSGNQSTSNNSDAVRNALLYENSIELDLASGMAVNWSFMRRHDFLQKGTPVSYPVPASELEINLDPIYTFGSEANSGSEGTATGANNWKNLTLTF